MERELLKLLRECKTMCREERKDFNLFEFYHWLIDRDNQDKMEKAFIKKD